MPYQTGVYQGLNYQPAMSLSINKPAYIATLSPISHAKKDSFINRTRKALKADITLNSIQELNSQQLNQLGDIRGLIFDLDDTLMPLPSGRFPAEILQQLKQLQNQGYKMGIVTNNPSAKYCQNAKNLLVQAGLYLPFIKGARKPYSIDLEAMIQHFNLHPSQVAMVGDSTLCDNWGGRKLGMSTVNAKWFKHSKPHKAMVITGDIFTVAVNKYRSLTPRNKGLIPRIIDIPSLPVQPWGPKTL